MLGLIYKDFCLIKKEISVNMLAIAFFSIMMLLPWESMIGYIGGNMGLVTGYTMSYIIMPVLSYFFIFFAVSGLQNGLISVDENRYYASWVVSTPMTVKKHVLSKYYGALIFSFGALVWGMLCDIISSFINGKVGSTMGIAIVFFFLELFISAFDIPFLIRFGYKYGNVFKSIAVSVITFGLIVYGLFGPLPKMEPDSLLWIAIEWLVKGANMNIVMTGVVSVFPYIAVLAYYISYKISVKMYLKGVDNYEC